MVSRLLAYVLQSGDEMGMRPTKRESTHASISLQNSDLRTAS